MKFTSKKLAVTLFLGLFLLCPVLANENYSEFDTLRAELSFLKDKNSPQYIKTKQKLDRYISRNKIDYSNYARYADIQRLITQQKYNSAIYELNSLIDEGFEISNCNMILGDIALKLDKTPKKIAHYYKLALQYDRFNSLASYKLAKLYLREKRNVLAIENLKLTIENTKDGALLADIENLIKNKITPQNGFEANNLYEALGNIYEKTGNLENAYEAYSKAIQINKKDIYLKYHLANLLFENDQNKGAISLYNSIINDNPQDYQIKANRAKTLIKDGNLLSADEQYQEILKRFPNSAQAKYGIFKIYENKLSPNEILAKIYSQNKNYSANINEIINFSSFLKDMGDIEGADKFEKCALQIKQQEEQERLKKLEEKNRLMALKEQEKLKQKETKEIKKEDKKPQITPQKETKKEVKKETIKPKKQIKKQEKIQKEVIKKEKTQEEILKEKALKEEKAKIEKEKQRVLEEEKEKQARIKKEKEIQELEKKAIEIERQKAIAKNPKKYNELKASADKYLAIEPKTAQIYMAIANTYKQMGEPTSAIKYLRDAMKIDPTNSDIYYNIGLTQFEQNKTQEAKTNLTKAINLDTDNTKAKNLLAFVNQKIVTQILNQAYSKYEKKEYVAAFEILDKGIKEYPKNSQMHYYRALIYCAMNRNAAAIYDLQNAIEFDPSNYMAYYQLGKTYEKIKDERSALVAYEKFLSIEPDEKDLIEEIEKKVINLGAKYY